MTPSISTDSFKPSFFGILNRQGQFWTPLIFDSEKAAQRHLDDFADQDRERFDAVRNYQIVPVRATIERRDEGHE